MADVNCLFSQLSKKAEHFAIKIKPQSLKKVSNFFTQCFKILNLIHKS